MADVLDQDEVDALLQAVAGGELGENKEDGSLAEAEAAYLRFQEAGAGQ